MKILKKIAIGLLVVVALLLVVGLFLPSTMHIECSKMMKADISVVFDNVNNTQKMQQWNPWPKQDPDIKTSYNDIPAGKGSSYSWTSKKMGDGTSTITESDPNSLIITNLDFGKQGSAIAGFKFDKEGDSTKVTWYLDTQKNNNPFSKIMMTVMKGMMESTFNSGLNDLKNIVEKLPATADTKTDAPIKVEMTTIEARDYMAIRDTANVTTISMKIGKGFGLIGQVMAKQKLKQNGPLFSIYYSDSETQFDFDACAPTDKAGKADGRVKPGKLKAGDAVVAHYFGDYMKMAVAYDAAKKYISENNKKVSGPPMEVYMNDPMSEKDTAKWATDVYFPVK